MGIKPSATLLALLSIGLTLPTCSGIQALVKYDANLVLKSDDFEIPDNPQPVKLAGKELSMKSVTVEEHKEGGFDATFTMSGNKLPDKQVTCHLCGDPGTASGLFYNLFNKKNYLDLFGPVGDYKVVTERVNMTCTPPSLEDYAKCLAGDLETGATKTCKFDDFD